MNNDTKTTLLGIAQAAGVGVADYLAHAQMDGGAIKQPTFWIGLVVAALMALKGYYTNKPTIVPPVK